jgi:hypothetical protein
MTDDASQLHNAVNSVDISSMLERFLKDPSGIEGEMHENGFHKLTFKIIKHGPVLRAHIWITGRHYGKDPGNIHNHRWSFVSRVLTGSMTTTSFIASSGGGQRHKHYLYDPDADPEMLYVGSSMLERQDVEVFEAGQCYYLDAQTIHQAEPLTGQPTVTLIARSEPKRKAADVYATQRIRELPGGSVPLSEAQILRDLQYVYELFLGTKQHH